MKVRVLIKIFGALLVVLGFLTSIPGIVAVAAGYGYANVFFSIGLLNLLLGALLWWTQADRSVELSHRVGFAVVAMTWCGACLVGALPYYLSGSLNSFVDALFEASSGFSGTGASVIADVEGLDPSSLFWRSLTQWLGGMGIIVFFIAILPTLGLEGVRLFKAETPGPSKDKITPRVRETAKRLWLYYVGLTTVLAGLLTFGGMTVFDAVCHAMTTTATGGFSTKNSGIAYYDSPFIDYILSIFMLIAATNSALIYKLIVQRDFSILRDTELKSFYLATGIATAYLGYLTLGTVYDSAADSIRYALFTVAATVSSTGFSHQDYILWPATTRFMILVLMFMGGMSGSTAGGIKAIRIVVAFKYIIKELKQLVHPHAVIPLKANDHSIPDRILNAIWGFFGLYFITTTVGTLALLLVSDLSPISALSAIVSALSNIGPALGTLGPTANFSGLSDSAKLIVSVCMILGRLEFYTVLVLFTKDYWRS